MYFGSIDYKKKKIKKNGLYNRTKTCQGSVLIQLDI